MSTNETNWIAELLRTLQLKKTIAAQQTITHLAAVNSLWLESSQWLSAVKTGVDYQLRFAGLWGQEEDDCLIINAIFESSSKYLLLRAKLELNQPTIASIASLYPAADRLERHAHDLLGIVFTDQPDSRRWTRHQAWSKNDFPLRRNFVKPETTKPTPPDNNYEFLHAIGSSICEVPVGPVHAGIIEPGHFRFQIAGEDVINLEERLGYVHKGLEKIAVGRNSSQLLKLAARVSGDSTVAHSWAAAQAFEQALETNIPERAAWLRAIMLERERIANHLGDIGALCNDVAFAFGFYQFGRLRELWQRTNANIFGHRLLMDKIILGGVTNDINHQHTEFMLEELRQLKQEINTLSPALEDSSSLQNRLQTTGILSNDLAKKLGALGYVGRASGQRFDARKQDKFFPYNQLTFPVPVLFEGDCAARLQIRMQEILSSLDLLQQLLTKIPAGTISVDNIKSKAGEGIGIVEGWRGEIISYLSINAQGLVTRFFPRDPSWFTWPALELLIDGNIVPDFPLCNKSVNGSYSGVDL